MKPQTVSLETGYPELFGYPCPLVMKNAQFSGARQTHAACNTEPGYPEPFGK